MGDEINDNGFDCNLISEKKRDILTRSKTGSLQPRTFNMEELKKKDRVVTKPVEKRDRDILDPYEINGSRLTRLKAQQISTGSFKIVFFEIVGNLIL